MDYTIENLESALFAVKIAIRNTPGMPASLEKESTASNHVYQILLWHKNLLIAITRKRSPRTKEMDILNSAYLYAVQPPIVKDTLKSTRKNFLRLQPWIDWLDEDTPTLNSFESSFRRWAWIFSQEYKKMQSRQNIDGVTISYTPKEITRLVKNKEVLTFLENQPSQDSEADFEVQRYQRAVFSKIIDQLRIDLENERKSKIAALLFLLHSLQWKEVPSYIQLRSCVLQKCVAWSGRSFSDLDQDLSKQIETLDPHKEILAARRVNKDYPLLSYFDLLSFLGLKTSDLNRYYVAINRYRKHLRKLSGGPEYINIKDL